MRLSSMDCNYETSFLSSLGFHFLSLSRVSLSSSNPSSKHQAITVFVVDHIDGRNRDRLETMSPVTMCSLSRSFYFQFLRFTNVIHFVCFAATIP